MRGLVVSPASFARQTSALKLRVATKPLLTVDEWRLWMKAGMELGSHTRTHVKLTELSPEEAKSKSSTPNVNWRRCLAMRRGTSATPTAALDLSIATWSSKQAT